ncbi:MAG: carboxymuconolactone decarboxylase [Rickettsiales bacterium]|nr:carboxymuconolactone decarboxylase [Rickettsiales bacterium]
MNQLHIKLLVIVLSFMHLGVSAQEAKASSTGLSAKQKSIVKIASLTAKGDLNALENSLNSGLDNGLSVNEIKEIIVHLYAYCGFPRSIRGLQTLISVLDERKARGIEDQWGREAAKINDTRNKYARGVETLEELIQNKLGPKPAYQEFSPEIDVFLKEHLFADIFERDVLTYQQRELTTISVIATLGNLDPMLRGHLNISMNVGLSRDQLEDFISTLESTVGKKKAKEANNVLREVLNARG